MSTIKIAVLGLGYVGLPLAHLFAAKYPVIGFDINEKRILELNKGIDSTLEVENDKLKAAIVSSPKEEKGLYCSNDIKDLEDCNPEALNSVRKIIYLINII